MNIIELKEKPNISNDVKLDRIYAVFQNFLEELRKRDWSNHPIEAVNRDAEAINRDIEKINSSSYTSNALRNLLKYKLGNIIMILRQNHKVVPQNYYRNQWTILTVIPLCPFILWITTTTTMNDWIPSVIISMGLIVAFIIGRSVAKNKDRKAFEEGRQLNIASNFWSYTYTPAH
ncbi:MAG: hypothetical protein FWG79_08085 [Bacteroidales bacterium]|nr:hypothetical protein [Bacteroidales bacterium]